jgi:hypothetical protein
MSKLGLGAAVSGVFAVAITVTPVPEEWRPYLVTGSWSLLAVLCLTWLIVHFWGRTSTAAEARSGFSAYGKHIEGDMITAAEESTASKISTGAGDINAPIAGRDVIYQPEKEKRPHLFVKLQIDSIESEYIQAHFDLTNGETQITNIRITHGSLGRSYREFEPLTGMMAPNAEVSTAPIFLARTPNDDNWVTLTAYFDATIESTSKNFISEHGFLVSKINLKVGSVIKPNRNNYREGIAPDVSHSLGDLMNLLTKDEGCFETVPHEGPRENPTVDVFAYKERMYRFDGAQRRVTFSTKTARGRIVNLSLPLKNTPNGYHPVLIGWKPTGGRLEVDGEKVHDYEGRTMT